MNVLDGIVDKRGREVINRAYNDFYWYNNWIYIADAVLEESNGIESIAEGNDDLVAQALEIQNASHESVENAKFLKEIVSE